jgi:hypothetical protein
MPAAQRFFALLELLLLDIYISSTTVESLSVIAAAVGAE